MNDANVMLVTCTKVAVELTVSIQAKECNSKLTAKKSETSISIMFDFNIN
jgi:hypothetical protein